MKAPPCSRVFISYSHDSEEHVDRVLAFCDRLRLNGIDADIDQYEPAPLKGWPRWMEQKIQEADFVLLVFTETYRRRFEGKEVSGGGLGAIWEGAIVTQGLYEAAGANSKFIPVTFTADDIKHIPLVLRGTTRYPLDKEDGYSQLYRRLTSQPAVPKPTLGPILPLPPRKRVASFSPGAQSRIFSKRQRGGIILSIILGTVILVALTCTVFLKRIASPQATSNRAVSLDPQLASVTSLSWSPAGSELFIVGARNVMESNHLLRYSRNGKLISEVVSQGESIRVERPASAQTVGSEFVVKDEHFFVWLTDQYHQRYMRDFLVQAPNGDSLESAFQWVIAGGNLFVLGDVRRGERESFSGGDPGQGQWDRGIVDVPLNSPSNFEMVRPIAKNSRLSGLYLIGYPHLASVGETAYFLEMQDTTNIVRLRPEEWNLSGFQVRLKGFGEMPDFSGKRGREAYSLFEGSAGIVGLYGRGDSLFILSKCPTIPSMPTRWFLTRFDPTNRKRIYTLSLPAASPHLMLAPGGNYWAVLEKGPAQPRENRRVIQKIGSLVLVPTSAIEASMSPLLVDSSLPLCSCPAIWTDDPPGWSFEQPKLGLETRHAN